MNSFLGAMRNVIAGIVRRFAAAFGYQIERIRPPVIRLMPGSPPSGERFGYELEEEAIESIEMVRNHTMLT